MKKFLPLYDLKVVLPNLSHVLKFADVEVLHCGTGRQERGYRLVPKTKSANLTFARNPHIQLSVSRCLQWKADPNGPIIESQTCFVVRLPTRCGTNNLDELWSMEYGLMKEGNTGIQAMKSRCIETTYSLAPLNHKSV